MLVRRLQRDPELPGVGAVILDEVHERHLDDDLALALLVDVRAHLREDLAVVAMSATVEARAHGGDARRGARGERRRCAVPRRRRPEPAAAPGGAGRTSAG